MQQSSRILAERLLLMSMPRFVLAESESKQVPSSQALIELEEADL